jgi:hypothetical protein
LIVAICLFSLPAYAKYSGGTGEPNDPYQIATAADLIALGEDPNDYDKHFLLTADIDLDPNLPGRKVFDKAVIGSQWNPFSGAYDGNGHTISHLTIVGAHYLGLFGGLGSAGEVKNLGVVDVNITGSGDNIGGLAGTSNHASVVVQCYSTGSVSGKGYIGGLAGENRGKCDPVLQHRGGLWSSNQLWHRGRYRRTSGRESWHSGRLLQHRFSQMLLSE